MVLQGRLGSDVELRTTPSGVEVATVNLAVDRDVKDKDGSRKTDWITVVAWRQRVIFLSRYFTKGRMAVVEGRLQIRDYTDRDGNKRTAAEVVADNVYFGDSKRDAEGGGYGGYGGGYSAPAPSAPVPPPAYAAPAGGDQFAELDDDDGELPF